MLLPVFFQHTVHLSSQKPLLLLDRSPAASWLRFKEFRSATARTRKDIIAGLSSSAVETTLNFFSLWAALCLLHGRKGPICLHEP